MYLVFAVIAGVLGGALSIGIRMELQSPELQIFANPHTYNVFLTAHGLIMIFFVIMPAMIGGFGNFSRTSKLFRVNQATHAAEEVISLGSGGAPLFLAEGTHPRMVLGADGSAYVVWDGGGIHLARIGTAAARFVSL